MMWSDVEKSFNRAFWGSFSWGAALLIFPALALSGILIIFCQALQIGSGQWMGQSLVFLPFLLSFAILLPAGVLVIRMYRCEQKGLSIGLKKVVADSIDLALGTSYFSIPPILLYLLLWMLLGIFFLIKEIPGAGQVVSVLLIFVPFLLIFGSMLLCVLSVVSLFFLSPIAAKTSPSKTELLKIALSLLRKNVFLRLLLFIIGALPLGIVGAILVFSASLAHSSFSGSGQSWTFALEWFFMMFPFAAILTPFVAFFFRFALEAHQLSDA